MLNTNTYLVRSDAAVREIIMDLDSEHHFIIEELDEQHLFVETAKIDFVKAHVERVLESNIYRSKDS